MMIRRVAALLVGLVVLAGGAQAATFSLGQGAVVEDGNTRIIVGFNASLSSLTFDASTGAPVFDGVMVNIETSSPSVWTWNHYNTGKAFVFNGSAAGTIKVSGPAREYFIKGIGPTIQTGGNALRTFSFSEGTKNVVVEVVPSAGEVINENIAGGVGGLLALLFAATVVGLVGVAFLARGRR